MRLRRISPGHWESEDGRHIFKQGWEMLDTRTGSTAVLPTLAQAFDKSQEHPAPETSWRVCVPSMPSRYYSGRISEWTVRVLYARWINIRSGGRLSIHPDRLEVELKEGAAEPIQLARLGPGG